MGRNSRNQNQETNESEPNLTEESSATEESNFDNAVIQNELEKQEDESDESSKDRHLFDLEKEAIIENSVPASENVIPEKLQMLKSFRIEMTLPGRTDAFLSLLLKKDQEITDKRIIKQLLKSDAIFEVIK